MKRTPSLCSVLLITLITGCSGPWDAPASRSSAPPASGGTAEQTAPAAPAAPSEDATSSETTAPGSTADLSLALDLSVESGPVSVTSGSSPDGSRAAATPDADTGAVLTVVLETPSTAVLLDARPAADGPAAQAPDRTAALMAADGTLVVGVSAPSAVGVDGSAPRMRWEPDVPVGADGTNAPVERALRLDAGDVDPSSFPLTVTAHLGTSVVASASWGDREGGRSLAVTPTDWGRVSGATGSATAWADLLAVEPEADTPGMQTQLQCHLIGARDKATWNLEPWRPDLGLVEYALARCNPT